MTFLPTDTRLALAALTLSLGAIACGGDAASTDPNQPFAVVSAGLATPESVLWDAARGVWYVSNINGSPTAKDDNGYILRLTADGVVMDSLPFINGADEDITLNAPKGMALVGDTLWVSDIDAIRAFNVTTGTAVTSLELAAQGATFLNDVAAAADGSIYITDSGMTFDASGNVVHSGQSRVFVLNGRNARPAVTLPAQSAANGIAFDAGRNAWLIVGFNSPSVFAWTPGSDSVRVVATGPGGGDGIVLLPDGRALFSSWADSALHLLSDSTVTRLRGGLPGPADLGFDAARRLVAVPLFTENRVEIWSVR
ncbi:MAG: hypothetical protein KF709_06775 [Gemmatimonadaceae bacterium]|nr:hypothetical protein [Gemmatimonadaceae bacterium]